MKHPKRPHIPLSVRCAVADRQLDRDYSNYLSQGLAAYKVLSGQLGLLARKLGCDRKDLRLDHNPALGVRKRLRSGRYVPDANDPDYLVYREKHDHHIKTTVAGDHGQYSDVALMKRERRRIKKEKGLGRKKWQWPKGKKLSSRKTFARSK